MPAQPVQAAIVQTTTVRAAESFWGKHQAGIVSPAQAHTYFAAFDLTTAKQDDLQALLRAWTRAASRLTAGQPIEPVQLPASYDQQTQPPVPDSGDATDLTAARLTITFGFGPGLFSKDGKDRYGLNAQRPEAFVDLPKFNGDQLAKELTGGDLSIQACADDPQVAFHAVRQLALMGDGVVEMRWAQTGFLSSPSGGRTPRNLMGFKDGTQQPNPAGNAVWVGPEGPAWMRGGSYMVVRRIRIALEHWDRTPVGFQEQTMGRHKASGAPLGLKDEFAPLGLDRMGSDENPVIPEHAHVRMAHAAAIGAAEMLRRGYSYNAGLSFTAERWPPWRQGMEFDAGLLFICYQKDPRTGFIKTFEDMAKFDMLNQFTTHVGGGAFACPPGVTAGGFVGEGLFRA
ncbi:MAG TPA: Dyp-type peroxidase [Rhodopila sp.]|nr:Dyp-type peroxidase [Rhodopila sp.]